jgi:hypothetical protein
MDEMKLPRLVTSPFQPDAEQYEALERIAERTGRTVEETFQDALTAFILKEKNSNN